jgi:hypothetical protein
VAEREVPREDAKVMPVGEPKKKRRKDRNQRKMKERPQGKDGCQKKLAVTHMEATWRNRASQKKLAVTHRGTTLHAKVAQQKENVVGRNCTRAMVERATQRVEPLKKNRMRV